MTTKKQRGLLRIEAVVDVEQLAQIEELRDWVHGLHDNADGVSINFAKLTFPADSGVNLNE